MAKDPAFLFFPGDWLGGTMLFTRHEKGAYFDLLMAQFNKFDEGHLSINEIEHILGGDFNLWDFKLKRKFKVDETGNYFNKKMEDEILKRRKFTERLKSNLNTIKDKSTPIADTIAKPYSNTLPENEYISTIVFNKEREKFLNDQIWIERNCMKYSIGFDEFKNHMTDWVDKLSQQDDIKDLKELRKHYMNLIEKLKREGKLKEHLKSSVKKSGGSFIKPLQSSNYGKKD